MDVISIRPERKAQLEQYAQCRGQDPAAALEGYEDVKAGRTKPANEFLEELRVKHALPR